MLTHLLELRKRAFYVILIYFLFFLLFFFFATHLFHALIAPLLAVLANQNSLIATQITAPLLIPLKLAADAALLCSMPFALLQIWRFVTPGLYNHEAYNLRVTMLSSFILFCLGVLFCFYLILPYMFQFFANSVPDGVRFMPDMAYALDFITRMLLLFGTCFQVPIICLFLVRLKWLDLQDLKKIRPYVIVGAFIFSMLLTPPDVLSQIMLAIPLCLLYELGIILACLL